MKISMHMIAVIVVTIAIIAGLSFMMLVKPDPEKIVTDAIEKQANLSDYTTEYDLSYKTKSGGVTLDAKGRIIVLKNSNATKVTLLLDTFGEKIKIDQYQAGNQTIQCISSLFNTTCQKSDSEMPVSAPQEQAEALKELIEQNALKLEYVSDKNIAGRQCDEIKTSYDPAQAGFGAATTGNIDVILCLDKENGMPLEMLMNLALTNEDSLDVKMTLTRINFDEVDIAVPEIE